MTDLPKIVLVDDDVDELTSVVALIESHGVSVTARYPGDVDALDLVQADVVLVDWNLKNWPDISVPSTPVALRPQDGLALAEVFRSHLGPTHSGRPTAFALHSGQLGDLRRGVPETIQEYALARVHNLEWVFAKGSSARATERFVSLALAVSALPHPWPTGTALGRTALAEWLAMPDDALVKESVEACNPPSGELAQNSSGLSVLRWFAQRVLPYPTFLIGDWYVAARLGITQQTLRADLQTGGPVSTWLADARYDGALAAFVEPRWWRTRVDDLIWDATNGTGSMRSVLSDLDRDLKVGILDVPSPVVCLDEHHRPHAIVDAEDAVRVVFDDRPTFALPAWISIDDARRDQLLASRVVLEDLDRIVQ